MFLLAAGVHTGIPLPNDRASRDGLPDVAPGPRAGAPFTQGRIPVRPQRRVRYAIGNNKSFGRVMVTLDRRAPIIAPPPRSQGSIALGKVRKVPPKALRRFPTAPTALIRYGCSSARTVPAGTAN